MIRERIALICSYANSLVKPEKALSGNKPTGRALAETFEYFAAQIFYSRGGTASSNPGKLRLRFGL